MRKNKILMRRMTVAAILFFSLFCVYASVHVLVNKARPFLTSQSVLTASKNADGSYVKEIHKTRGLIDYAGKIVDFFLGGDFASSSGLASAVSGNLGEDQEHVTVLDSPIPTAASPQIPQLTAQSIEKTIGSADGKTKVNGKISINNETKYSLDLNSLLDGKKPFTAKDSPQVLIVHSHATESYQPTSAHPFTHTSTDRSTDTANNMVAVGDELEKELKLLGIGAVHLRNLYDYPEYNNSYARSCKDVEAALKKNPSIKIVLDLHRDAITTKEGKKTKITTTIGNEKVAQVMLVVGTDELGLKHDNWRTNLKYAVNLQQQLLKAGPNFARPINLRTSRFNGHTAPGALIIEVGAAGNAFDEALASAKYIAKAVAQTIK